MQGFFTVLRSVAFLLLLFSGCYVLRKRGNVLATICPIVICASVTLAVLFGGLIGQLSAACVFVTLIGAVCVLDFLRDFGSGVVTVPRVSVFHLGFFAFVLCFTLALARTSLVHYDNFSHWALVLKEMRLTGAVPVAEGGLVSFKNYPLGAVSWLYYAGIFFGDREGAMLAAQNLLISACLYALFAVLRETRRLLQFAVLSVGVGVLFILNITIRVDNLLVDFLLSLLALAAIAVLHCYQSAFVKGAVLVAPVLGLLVAVKNTGVVFAVFVFVFWGFLLAHAPRKLRKTGALSLFSTGLFAAFVVFSWEVYQRVYMAQVEHKFSLSLADGLAGLLAGKTMAQHRAICITFFMQALDIRTRPVQVLLAMHVLCLACVIITRRCCAYRWRLGRVLAVLDVALVLYYTGILGMYLFMMPLDEALVLAGFERYASSMMVFYTGALFLAISIAIERSYYLTADADASEYAFASVAHKKKYQQLLLASVGLALLLVCSEYNGLAYHRQIYDTTTPAQLRALVGDSWPEGGAVRTEKYLIYAPKHRADVESELLQQIGRYYLYAQTVEAVARVSSAQLLAELEQYDVLIILDSDAMVQAVLAEVYGIENAQRGVYALS